MQKKIHNILLGISVLPAVLIMPATALELDLYGEETVEAGLYADAPNRYLWVNPDATVTIKAGAIFRNNQRNTNGGVREGNGGAIVVQDETGVLNLQGTANNKVVFDANYSEWNGGAIINEGKMDINYSVFKNNYVTGNLDADSNPTYEYIFTPEEGEPENLNSTGGAIYNGGIVVIKNSAFSGNKAGDAGAIYNSGTLTITGSTFTSNYAKVGGGAILQPFNVANVITVKNSSFSENTAGYAAAIGAYNQLNVENSTFNNNIALDVDNSGGGAIMIGGHGKVEIKGSSFSGNTANAGGAIATRPRGANAMGDAATTDDNKDGHWMVITNSTFNNNVAGVDKDGTDISGVTVVYGRNSMITGDGGAIWHGFEGTTVGGVEHKNIISGSTFTNNTAKRNGGAIYNEGNLTISDTQFSSNVSVGAGGAIYNYDDGNLIFAGTNTFSGNTANGVANDIHNIGALTFDTGSKTTMDGGVTGTGTLNVADGATLNLGTASIAQSTITLDGALNAVLRSEDEFAFFDVSDSFGGTGALNLELRGAGTYNVFNDKVFDNEKVVISSSAFDYDWNEDFDTITVTMKSVEDIAADNGLTNEAAQTVANLVNSSSEKLNDLAGAMQDSLESGDAASVEQAHAAIHPETESVVQTVAMSVQNTVANLASNRLMALNIGRNGGDVNVTGGGVWAQGIYNKTKQNDAFRGYTRGVAGGVDMTLNRALTLGAGYSYAHSDISGTARNTEVDSSTIFAYGQYKPTNWFMHAVANYTMSDYSERAVALGTAIDASYDVHSYGGQLMTGYDFAGGITPSVGVRYMHITADEYKNSLGIKNKLADSDYMTAILETKWTYGFKMNKHLMLRPELRYAVKYDVMSDEQTATVLLPGVDSYVMSGNRLSRIAGEFGGGLGVKINGLDLSVNYEIELREGFTSQTGRARIRYEF